VLQNICVNGVKRVRTWLPSVQPPSAAPDPNLYWHRQILPYMGLGITDFKDVANLKKNPYVCPADSAPYYGVVSYGINGWLCPAGDSFQRGKSVALPVSRVLLVDYSSQTPPVVASRWSNDATVQANLRFSHADRANVVRLDGSVFSATADELGTPSSNPELWKP
jgi:hypothetical protein